MEYLLGVALWTVTYVQPIILGARLIRTENAKPVEVLNMTLAVVFVWLAEFLDALILGKLIAMRWLYMSLRIALALYWMHPRFLGAWKTFHYYLQPLIEKNAGTIDAVVTSHLEEMRTTGHVKYVLNAVTKGSTWVHSSVHQLANHKRE